MMIIYWVTCYLFILFYSFSILIHYFFFFFPRIYTHTYYKNVGIFFSIKLNYSKKEPPTNSLRRESPGTSS